MVRRRGNGKFEFREEVVYGKSCGGGGSNSSGGGRAPLHKTNNKHLTRDDLKSAASKWLESQFPPPSRSQQTKPTSTPDSSNHRGQQKAHHRERCGARRGARRAGKARAGRRRGADATSPRNRARRLSRPARAPVGEGGLCCAVLLCCAAVLCCCAVKCCAAPPRFARGCASPHARSRAAARKGVRSRAARCGASAVRGAVCDIPSLPAAEDPSWRAAAAAPPPPLPPLPPLPLLLPPLPLLFPARRARGGGAGERFYAPRDMSARARAHPRARPHTARASSHLVPCCSACPSPCWRLVPSRVRVLRSAA